MCDHLYLRQQQQGDISWNRTNCVADNEGFFLTPGAGLPSVAGHLLAGVDVDVTDVQGNPTLVQSGCNPVNMLAKAKRQCCLPVESPGGTCNVWSRVVMLVDQVLMLAEHRYNHRTKNLVYVTPCCEVTLADDKLGLKPVVYRCPDHNSAPSVRIGLNNAIVNVAFVTSPVHTDTPVGVP